MMILTLPSRFARLLPGVAVAALLAVTASAIVGVLGWHVVSPLVLAVLLGMSGATADELRKAYDAAKGVSAVVTQIVIDQMKAKGVSVGWADQFKTMFAAYAENDAAIRQRGGSDEQAAGNLQYWVGVRDRLAQDIPTSELLALLGQGATIEPNSPDTWDLRVKYWLHQRGVPGFERGGQHVGGARVVGERGAELEVTGPARYWTHDHGMGDASECVADQLNGTSQHRHAIISLCIDHQ